MAGFLVGYHYEPEYTPEELEARCKAAVRVCTEATSAGLGEHVKKHVLRFLRCTFFNFFGLYSSARAERAHVVRF